MDLPDHELNFLLNLNGESFEYDQGFKINFKAKKVKPSEQIPHGIRYSLTLHDKHNHRVFGIDNAHGIDAKEGGKYSARILAWDHQHKEDKILPFFFEGPGELLEYFQEEIEKIIHKK